MVAKIMIKKGWNQTRQEKNWDGMATRKALESQLGDTGKRQNKRVKQNLGIRQDTSNEKQAWASKNRSLQHSFGQENHWGAMNKQ